MQESFLRKKVYFSASSFLKILNGESRAAPSDHLDKTRVGPQFYLAAQKLAWDAVH